LDIKLLLSALQQTLEFEHYLEKRFSQAVRPHLKLMKERESMDTVSSKGEERTLIFGKAISEAFEPYLSLYIDSQDQILSNKLQTFKNERNHPRKQEDEAPSTVLPSSADLFAFYRQTFSQCAKLSTSTPLVDLSKLFGKWLQLYAEQILTPPLESKTLIPTDEICTILNTADYCLTTTTQLEERIKAKVDEPLREQVQFDTPRDSFITVANAAIKLLVRKIEMEADLSFREMVNTNWSTIETVGDHSGYVIEMNRAIKDAVSSISANGHLRERYIRSLCDRVVEWFGSRFVDGIIASRPICEAGAEQMLLDVYVLKQGLLELPVLNTDPPVQAPALYSLI
jgi:vacuolar protein sorting-associated protein 53